MSISSKPASLDGSLLFARKGEAIPAITANQHNNPGYAWGESLHPDDFQAEIYPLHPEQRDAEKNETQRHELNDNQTSNHVDMTLKMDLDLLLRIQYVAQNSNKRVQNVIHEAIDKHLNTNGVLGHHKLSVRRF